MRSRNKIYIIKILINFTFLRKNVKGSTCTPVIQALLFRSDLIVWKGIWNLSMQESEMSEQQQQRLQQQQHSLSLPVPQQQQQQHNNKNKALFPTIMSRPNMFGTYLVKMLLQHCTAKVYPPSQRILWLNKQWQPLLISWNPLCILLSSSFRVFH